MSTAKTINLDYQKILKRKELKELNDALEYMSIKNKGIVEAAFSVLLKELKKRDKFIILLNANKTATLAEIENQRKKLRKDFQEVNNYANLFLKETRDQIEKDKLDKLREIEVEIQKKL